MANGTGVCIDVAKVKWFNIKRLMVSSLPQKGVTHLGLKKCSNELKIPLAPHRYELAC